jgi:hypothetical protein
VIPADRKWFARLGVGAVLVHALMEIDPRYPTVTAEHRRELLEVRGRLEEQAPKGKPRDAFAQQQGNGDRPELAERAEQAV